MSSLLEVSQLCKFYPVRSGWMGRPSHYLRAVDRVSFALSAGETLGLVGESGCGKTTLGRAMLRLIEPDSGSVNFDGLMVTRLSRTQLRKLRPKMQMIFQDPYASLNPRMVTLDLVGEGLTEHGAVKTRPEKREAVSALLEQVGLSPDYLDRYSHEFSGGQRQRLAIARAIALHPSLVVCDEAVSALDVSIQAQILKLLVDLQQKLNIAYLFISHDLAVVKHIAHRIAVMYLGQIVESGATGELFAAPLHPYTEALLSAVLVSGVRSQKRQQLILRGEAEEPGRQAQGCGFAPRCPKVMSVCRRGEPPVRYDTATHWVKCFR